MKTRTLCAAVAAAALCVATAPSPSFAATLTHRWSFNGSSDAECLADSVGTANAVKKAGGKVTWSDGRAVFEGGGAAGYLDLGIGVIDSDDATLEFWVTPGTQTTWSYMFTYGICDSDGKNLFTLSWARERSTENDRLARNALDLNYGGTGYGGGEQQFGTFVPGVPYHFSMTFKKNGSDTVLRLMSRNTTTGAILSEKTVTIPGWTTATAAANGWALTLGHNPYNNNNYDNVATYDDVRVWNGVLNDDQLAAGVVAGPDVILGGRTTADPDGFDIASGSTFTIATNGMFWTSGTVGVGADASIVFDTANYIGTEMKFVTGGFTLPSGSSSVLDFVTLTDSDNFTASVDGGTITVASAQPAYAKWTGASAPTSAADLANAANWTCYGKDCSTVVPGAVPGSATTLLIDGTTSFSMPAGLSPTWGAVLVGGHAATMKAKRAGSPGNFSSAWLDKPASEFNTSIAQTEITYLYRSASAGDSPAEMAQSLLRFDGWVYVSAAKAGKWVLNHAFDDVFALALDGDWIFAHPTWRYGRTSGCYVSEGWHRFKVLAGDTGGGWGAAFTLGSMKYPFVIAVNGGSNIAFTSDNFTFGSGSSAVTLDADCDWSAFGEVNFANGVVLDLNGHNLKLDDLTTDGLGSMVTNTSSTTSTMIFDKDPFSSNANLQGIIRGVGVNIDLVQDGAKSATWTGGGNDGDPANPDNWEVKLGTLVLGNTVPDSRTAVVMQGQNINMSLAGTALSCSSFQIGNCTFTADCDWRGLSVTPSISGTADLNGHNLQLNNLNAVSGSFANGAADTTSRVVFEMQQSIYSTFSEQSFIDNIANLSTGNGVLLSLKMPDDNRAFLVTEFLVGRSANVAAEFLQANGAVSLGDKVHQLGVGSGNRGIYTMNGGTMTTGGSSEFQIGSTGNGTFNLVGGDVTINCWISVGRWGGGNGTFNMTGGTLTVAKSLPMWLGGSNGTGVFNFGGTATANFQGIDIGREKSAKGYLNMDGGTLNVSNGDGFNVGRDAAGTVVQNGGTLNVNNTFRLAWGNANDTIVGSYTLNGGTVNANTNFFIGVGRIANYVQNGGTMNAKSGVTIAYGTTSKATVTLAGGVFNTKFIKKGEGTLNGLTFDGGTVAAMENVSDGSAFFDGISSVNVGAGGMTFDTSVYDVAIDGLGMTPTAVNSSFTKAGDGTLTMDALPATPVVVVSNGIFRVLSAAPGEVVVPGLLHRWSFNGETDEANLADAVGGAVGTKIGEAVAFENGEAVLSGDGNSAGSLNLGTGLLGTGEGATIEIWATRTDVKSNARVFDYGTDENNFFMLAWNTASEGEINFRVRKNGGSQLGHNGGVPWTTGEKCHVFITFKTRDDGSGKPRIGWFAYDPATGRRLNADEFDINSADLSLADLANASFYLGHSQFADHADANARYDEVRIWDGVLSESAMARSVELGPDATAAQLAGVGEISASGDTALAVAPGATFDMTGVSLSRAAVSGGGKVAGGTLTATRELRAKLGDCLVIDGGTFNVDCVKVVFSAEDLATLETSHKSYTLVRAVNGGRIVGSPLQPATDAQLPTGWHVTATSGSVTLFKGGMTLFLR